MFRPDRCVLGAAVLGAAALALGLAACLASGRPAAGAARAQGSGLRFEAEPEQRLVWSGLGSGLESALARAQQLLTLTVAAAQRSPRPMLGQYRAEQGALVFVPRFPLRPGRTYRAVAHPARLPGARGDEPDVLLTVSLEVPDPGPRTEVSAVYPGGAVLPANVLKFYVHFSAPMARGEAYERVHLVDAAGRAIVQPFLELGEELWNREGTRLTLFLDPGRVKRGLFLHDELGPVFEPGEDYTLVIDEGWIDASGRALAAGVRRPFRAGEHDHEQPRPERWSVSAPRAGTREPLGLAADEALDRALFARAVSLFHADGTRVEGQARVGPDGRAWSWVPTHEWRAGEYAFVVEPILEDLAGNSVGRPFEDVLAGVETLSVGTPGADERRSVVFSIGE